MLFSVVIPLYNKRAFIGLTLDCLFQQTCPDFEVIVVDDGSTDGGPEFIENAYSEPRLRLIRQANAGVSAARNKGIQEAKGEWVAFLDADDCWHPDLLTCMERLITQHPTFSMVAVRVRFVPDSPGWSPLPWKEYDPSVRAEVITDLPTRWMQSLTFCTGAVAVKAAHLRRMQPCFPPGESNGEDLDLWFRLAEETSIAWMPQDLMVYRAGTTASLTSGHRALEEPPYLARMEKRAKSGRLTGEQSRSALKFVADQRVTMARKAHMRGDSRAAWRWLFSSGGHRFTRRWYVSLLMMSLLPGSAMKRWEAWRVARVNRE